MHVEQLFFAAVRP